MTLDLTTFLLQILNFLVLLWLLHRFVYGPLRAAIAKRQAAAEAAEAAYQTKLQALEKERTELQQQRADLKIEQQKALVTLTEEIARERTSRLVALEKELAATLDRGTAKLEAQLKEREARSNLTLQKQVDQVLRAHLTRLANPALEAVLVQQLMEDLAQLDPAQVVELQPLAGTDPLEISSAFPISAEQQAQLLTTLSKLLGKPMQARWKQDARLLAGIRIGLDGKEIEFGLGNALQLLPELIRRQTETQGTP